MIKQSFRFLASFARKRLVFLGLFLLGLAANAAPLPPQQKLNDAIFGGGTFVGVGTNGTILSSVNFGPWELRVSGTTNNLQSVAYGGGMFVAAGANGTLLSSPNGVDWTVRSVGGSWTNPDVAYGNGRFVVGAKGPGAVWTMLVSSNAADWTAADVEAPGPNEVPLPFGGIAFGEGKFLAVGGLHEAALVVTSTDGLIWQEQGANLLPASSAIQGPITFGSGKFALVVNNHYDDDDDGSFYFDQVLLSDDGASWQWTHLNGFDFTAIAAADCTFVAANSFTGTNGVWYSHGGLYWTNLALPSAMSVRAITYGNGKFVAVGSDIMELNIPSATDSFSVQPQAQEVFTGNSAYFYIALPPCFDGPLRYQWRHNSVPIAGATNDNLYLSIVTTNDAGQYTLIASGAAGLTATSTVATLTVVEYTRNPSPPKILWPVTDVIQPTSLGADYSLTIGWDGWPVPSFQWRLDATDIPGATNSSLSLYNVDSRVAGEYSVVLSNYLGSVTSAVITAVTATAPPRLFVTTNRFTVVEGDTAEFPWPFTEIGAAAAPPATYYVFKDGTNSLLPLSSFGQFRLRDISPADAGQYSIVASNEFGMSTGLVAIIEVAAARGLDRWTRRNPLPQNDVLLDVAYSNGRFVAVGHRSGIVVSTNGTDWSSHPVKSEVTLEGIAFGNGVFVAVGEGSILSSTDGQAWAARLNRSSVGLQSVVFGNGRFVAVGWEGILTSTDGIHWSDATLPLLQPRNFRAAAFGNGIFVATSAYNQIWTSPDGVNWSPLSGSDATPFPSAAIEDINFANGLFVAVGDDGAIFTSPNGMTWTSRDSDVSNRLIGVTYGNGRFVVVGTRGRILSSANGTSWTRETSGTPDRLESATFADGLFIAVGENSTILSSPNGSTWTKRNRGVTRDLDGMTIANGTIVVAGKGGTILTSTDGTNFIQRASGTINDLHGVSWGEGLFVAVGEPETILTSPDAIQWTLRHAGTTSSLKGATKGNGTWVAVGTQGTVLTSSDGVNWLRRESYTLNDLNAVAYGSGPHASGFVVVGDNLPPNGTLLTSPDGINWKRRNQYIGKNLRTVAFANNIFLAAGNDGSILVSSNGLTWVSRYTGLFGNYDNNLRAIGYAPGMWVIVGNEGLVVTSPDTVEWFRRPRLVRDNLHGIGPHASGFVAIGNRGTIIQSDTYLVGPTLVAAGFTPQGFQLTITGDIGTSFTLEAAPSLTVLNWMLLGTYTFREGSTTLQVTDFADTNSPTRFYRAISR